MSHLTTAAWIRALASVLGFTSSLVVALVTFLFHSLVLGEPLRADAAWSVVALFNVLRFPITVAPLGLRFVSEALVGIERAQAFLLLPEAMEDDRPTQLPPLTGLASASGTADARGVNHDGKAEADPELKPASTAPIAVQLQDATYSWYRQEDRDREQALSQTLQRKGGRASPAPGTGGSGGGLSRGRGKAGDAPAVLSMEAGSSTGESVDDTSSGGFHLKNISL